MKESIAVANRATVQTPVSLRSFAKTIFALIAPLLFHTATFAQKPPISGASTPEFASIDQAALEYRSTIDCDAVTVAISRDGQLLYARGFGWRDAKHKVPTQSSTLMRIASVTKPITKAAVRKLVREHKLSYDTKAFEYLKLSPPSGAKQDPRLDDITVQMLLDHKGGWDRKQIKFDPMMNSQKVEQTLGLKHAARPADVIRYMLGQPLQFDPGSRSEYSNFGFCVLGRMIEKASGKPYLAYIRDEILQPIGITDIKLARTAPKDRDPEEASYPADVIVEVMDSHGGLIASAPSLCTFMDHYWINGEPRHADEHGNWNFFGSLPGTTTMVYQRTDGYNIAVLCNNRREDSVEEDEVTLIKLMDKALDQVAKPKPTKQTEIESGAGSFQFVDKLGNADKPIRVWYYSPEQLAPETPIVFVMHGVQRNGERYRDEWKSYAQKYNFLLLCPEFDEKNYPTDAYQWGNMFDAKKQPVPESKWTFTAIEHLFDYVKKQTDNSNNTYNIFGHSAGGQFVHRFALFMPRARYGLAIAANPGWYTMPNFTDHRFPYSLRGSNLSEAKLKQSFGRNFLLMLGEEDQDPNDPELRKTAEAEEQGATRFERGQNYIKAARAEANELQTPFKWHLATVPGAHHSDKQMARAAVLKFFPANSDQK